MEKEKKILIMFRVDRQVHEKIKVLSEDEERTMASIIRQAVKEFLKKRGG